MTYTFGIETHAEFVDVVDRVTEALAAEGFGILSTIDVAATLRAKLGVERESYLILGACNPPLAHRAIAADPDIGALLPCNVVVRQDPDAVAVRSWTRSPCSRWWTTRRSRNWPPRYEPGWSGSPPRSDRRPRLAA
jgi:uncharacterized protein (DUF302 family)